MSQVELFPPAGGPITSEQRSRVGARRVVASVSGGKDSAAMSLWLTENGIEHDRVFMDTGWEHGLTYEYLRGPLAAKLGAIHEIRGPRLMEELVMHKGMFPSRVRRFCTQELKVKPLYAYLNTRIDQGEDVVNAVGIRRAESQARAHMPEWEHSEGLDCEVWRPLVRWSEDDVIAIHKRHGLRPNPLYLMGASRVGCWPCIYARKSEIRLVAETDPARIEKIRVLEEAVDVQQKARAIKRGGSRPSGQLFSASGRSARGLVPALRSTKWSRGRRRRTAVSRPTRTSCRVTRAA